MAEAPAPSAAQFRAKLLGGFLLLVLGIVGPPILVFVGSWSIWKTWGTMGGIRAVAILEIALALVSVVLIARRKWLPFAIPAALFASLFGLVCGFCSGLPVLL